jgi:hypothetical protein
MGKILHILMLYMHVYICIYIYTYTYNSTLFSQQTCNMGLLFSFADEDDSEEVNSFVYWCV